MVVGEEEGEEGGPLAVEGGDKMLDRVAVAPRVKSVTPQSHATADSTPARGPNAAATRVARPPSPPGTRLLQNTRCDHYTVLQQR